MSVRLGILSRETTIVQLAAHTADDAFTVRPPHPRDVPKKGYPQKVAHFRTSEVFSFDSGYDGTEIDRGKGVFSNYKMIKIVTAKRPGGISLSHHSVRISF